MRKIILLAFMVGVFAGYVARMNADPRVWPPMVEGQAFPVQLMNDKN